LYSSYIMCYYGFLALVKILSKIFNFTFYHTITNFQQVWYIYIRKLEVCSLPETARLAAP
jgi:hypothetical protein